MFCNFDISYDILNLQDTTSPSNIRFIAIISSYRLLHHGVDAGSMHDDRDCLQADETYKTNSHGFPILIVGAFMTLFFL